MKKIYLLVLLASLFSLGACDKFNSEIESPNSRSDSDNSGRTLLVYLAMDNSLSYYAAANTRSLLRGATRRSLGNGRVVIYQAAETHTPYLLQIKLDRYGRSYLDTLVRYPAQDPTSTAVMRQVIDDTKRLAPSSSGKYAIDLGSHASGWMPVGATTGLLMAKSGSGSGYESYVPSSAMSETPLSRYLLQSGRTVSNITAMELADFASTIHDGEFEYIMFDACYMGDIETTYALRNKARWIVAAPSEIPEPGMPYDLILGDLMSSTPNLAAVCLKYYNYYSSASATIALYDCTKVQALTDAMAPVLSQYKSQILTMSAVGIQNFDTSWGSTKRYKFDLDAFVANLIPNAADPRRKSIEQALSQLVVVKYSTPTIKFVYTIPVNTYCGLATFIPTTGDPATGISAALVNKYKQTVWWAATYGN